MWGGGGGRVRQQERWSNDRVKNIMTLTLCLQLALQCMVSSEGSIGATGEVVEVILDRGITVSECCAAMVMATGLTGENK